jgi:hypothetical protein
MEDCVPTPPSKSLTPWSSPSRRWGGQGCTQPSTSCKPWSSPSRKWGRNGPRTQLVACA